MRNTGLVVSAFKVNLTDADTGVTGQKWGISTHIDIN